MTEGIFFSCSGLDLVKENIHCLALSGDNQRLAASGHHGSVVVSNWSMYDVNMGGMRLIDTTNTSSYTSQ